MLHHTFTVYDQKAEAHLPPFFLPRVDMALRVFSDCCNDSTHQFGRHPEDYTLLEIATFDDEEGTINPHNIPIVHGLGIKFLQSAAQLAADGRVKNV